MRARLVVAALALLAASCGGGSGTVSINNSCPKVDDLGGDPTGKWGVTSFCQVPYARAASADLCSMLVYDSVSVQDGLVLGGGVTSVVPPSVVEFATPPGPPCGPPGTCGTYSAQLIFGGTTATTVFPMSCLTQHNPNPSCPDLQAKIRALIPQNALAQTVYQNLTDANDPKNLTCVTAADGDGCACTYNLTNAILAPDLGAWRLDGNLLETYSGTDAEAGIVDFFLDGPDKLVLHGHNGMPLLPRDPVAPDPLRNLELVRCTDDTIRSGICSCDKDAAMRGVCTLPH